MARAAAGICWGIIGRHLKDISIYFYAKRIWNWESEGSGITWTQLLLLNHRLSGCQSNFTRASTTAVLVLGPRIYGIHYNTSDFPALFRNNQSKTSFDNLVCLLAQQAPPSQLTTAILLTYSGFMHIFVQQCLETVENRNTQMNFNLFGSLVDNRITRNTIFGFAVWYIANKILWNWADRLFKISYLKKITLKWKKIKAI